MTAQVLNMSSFIAVCPSCEGRKEVGDMTIKSGRVQSIEIKACPTCHGRGRLVKKPRPVDPWEAFGGVP